MAACDSLCVNGALLRLLCRRSHLILSAQSRDSFRQSFTQIFGHRKLLEADDLTQKMTFERINRLLSVYFLHFTPVRLKQTRMQNRPRARPRAWRLTRCRRDPKQPLRSLRASSIHWACVHQPSKALSQTYSSAGAAGFRVGSPVCALPSVHSLRTSGGKNVPV